MISNKLIYLLLIFVIIIYILNKNKLEDKKIEKFDVLPSSLPSNNTMYIVISTSLVLILILLFISIKFSNKTVNNGTEEIVSTDSGDVEISNDEISVNDVSEN